MADKLQSLDHRLTNCSLQSTLKKGYAYIKNEEGKIFSKASSLQNKAKIIAHFKDGSRNLRVED
jgi:exonuclease VII large subunit